MGHSVPVSPGVSESNFGHDSNWLQRVRWAAAHQ